MSIEAKCPECGKGYRFRDEQAGKPFKCKDCGAKFAIEEDEPAPTRTSASGGGRKKKRKSPSPPVALYAVLGVLVIGLAFFWFLRNRPARPKANDSAPNGQAAVAIGDSNTTPMTVAAPAPVSPFDAGLPVWRLTVDPAPAEYDVSTAAVKLPTETLKDGAEVYTPTTASPFILISEKNEHTVWDLRAGKATAKFSADLSTRGRVLSPDGQLLAHEPNVNGKQYIEVLSTQDGKLLFDRKVEDLTHPAGPSSRRTSQDGFDFAAPGQLLVVGSSSHGKWLELFDIKTGASVRKILGPKSFYNFEMSVFSPGRRYLLSDYDKNLVCIDLATGEQAGLMPMPRARKTDASLTLRGIGFTPDGTRLAGIFDYLDEDRLVAWDVATAQSFADIELGSDLATGGASSVPPHRVVQWLPGKGGWLLYGYTFLHGASGKLVMTLRSGSQLPYLIDYSQIVEGDQIAVLTGNYGERQLRVLPLPLEDITGSLAALKDKSPAQLRPGDAVSVEVDVKNIRFAKPEEAKANLMKAITKRLESQGFSVAEGKPMVFYCRYEEVMGKTLHEMTGKMPFLPGAAPSGRSIEATDVKCEIGWKLKEQDKPLWQDQLDYQALFHSSRGELSPQSIRNEIAERVLSNIESHPIVYYIPDSKDKESAPLPLVISIDAKEGK